MSELAGLLIALWALICAFRDRRKRQLASLVRSSVNSMAVMRDGSAYVWSTPWAQTVLPAAAELMALRWRRPIRYAGGDQVRLDPSLRRRWAWDSMGRWRKLVLRGPLLRLYCRLCPSVLPPAHWVCSGSNAGTNVPWTVGPRT